MTNINNNTTATKTIKKITQREALTSAINCGALSAEVVEKLSAMLAQLDKKSVNRTHGESKVAKANEPLKEAIIESGLTNKTATEFIKNVEALNELSNQKVANLLNSLVETGKVTKRTEKGKTLFSVVKGA